MPADAHRLQAEQRLAAAAAVELVQPGMVVGIGTGSTASHAIRLLAERFAAGLPITALPTSRRSEALARGLGLPLVELETVGQVDLTIDGADEFDPALNLIKGGGGALLREKIVAFASRQVVIITDSAKRVEMLGRFPLPCEVLPFASRALAAYLGETFRIPARLRIAAGTGEPMLTDQGNHLLDCDFGQIADPPALAARLEKIPGLLEHGLFCGLAHRILSARGAGVESWSRPASPL